MVDTLAGDLAIKIDLTPEVGSFARLNHALTGMVTICAVGKSASERDHGRETVVQTGAAPNLGREPDQAVHLQ